MDMAWIIGAAVLAAGWTMLLLISSERARRNLEPAAPPTRTQPTPAQPDKRLAA
jgi:hypothetical protein